MELEGTLENNSMLKNQQAAPIQDLGIRRKFFTKQNTKNKNKNTKNNPLNHCFVGNYEDDGHDREEEERMKERDELPEDIADLTAVSSKN